MVILHCFTATVRVLELAELRSKAAIVIFTTCVSRLGKETVRNTTLGFSHAVLASGASSCLGGVWNVNNQATMQLTHIFYHLLKDSLPGVSFATCWRNAQIELYRTDQRPAIELLKDMGHIWDTEDSKRNILEDNLLWIRSRINMAIKNIQEMGLDYIHPYFPAPFVLIGYGGLVLMTEISIFDVFSRLFNVVTIKSRAGNLRLVACIVSSP